MRASTPFKVGENAHKTTKIINLINLSGLRVFINMVNNKKVKIYGRRSDWEKQGSGNH
jgi:hypothetical protein